jgi:hypothetical protein
MWKLLVEVRGIIEAPLVASCFSRSATLAQAMQKCAEKEGFKTTLVAMDDDWKRTLPVKFDNQDEI